MLLSNFEYSIAFCLQPRNLTQITCSHLRVGSVVSPLLVVVGVSGRCLRKGRVPCKVRKFLCRRNGKAGRKGECTCVSFGYYPQYRQESLPNTPVREFLSNSNINDKHGNLTNIRYTGPDFMINIGRSWWNNFIVLTLK